MPAADVGKQEAGRGINEADDNIHSEVDGRMVDPERIGEAELAKSLDAEVGNTAGAANENSRESKTKQKKKKKLTYHDSAHVPTRILDRNTIHWPSGNSQTLGQCRTCTTGYTGN